MSGPAITVESVEVENPTLKPDCELVVTKGPEVLQSPPEGESHLYTLAIADPSLAHDSALKVDIPGDKKSAMTGLPTAYDASSGWRYLCLPGSNYPAMFSLEFGMKYDGRAGLSLTDGKLMRRRPEAAMLPPDQRFRYGFHLGMGFSCLDVAFGKDRWISQGLHYDQIAGGMVMPVVVRPGRGKAEKVSVTFPANLGGQGLEAPTLFKMSELCLYSIQFFASGDPRAEELGIALLTDDWSEIGLAYQEWGRRIFYQS